MNCHGLKRGKEQDFPQWEFGNVISNFSDFPGKLSSIFKDHPDFITNQSSFIHSTFDSNDLSSGKRGAEAIINHFSL